jgi:hypothetical protein
MPIKKPDRVVAVPALDFGDDDVSEQYLIHKTYVLARFTCPILRMA